MENSSERTSNSSEVSEARSANSAAMSLSDVKALAHAALKEKELRSEPAEPPSGASHDVTPGRQVLYMADAINSRLDGGESRNLTKLNPRHRLCIALHLSGWTLQEIANHVGYNPAYISIVLNDPLCRRIIDGFDELHEQEFMRLKASANEVLRDSMSPDQPIGMRLRGAATFYKREADMNKDSGGETAEDVMQRILQRIEAENVQINFNISPAAGGS